jgi:hypothetical protein
MISDELREITIGRDAACGAGSDVRALFVYALMAMDHEARSRRIDQTIRTIVLGLRRNRTTVGCEHDVERITASETGIDRHSPELGVVTLLR